MIHTVVLFEILSVRCHVKLDGRIWKPQVFFGFSLTPQDLGLEVCKVFQQQSYYYQLVPINNWQVTFFRAYPHPWELLGRKILQIYRESFS